METFSALLAICEGNVAVGMRIIGVFFVVSLDKLLNKKSKCCQYDRCL